MKALRFLSFLFFTAMLCFANDKNCENTIIGNYTVGYKCFYPKQNIANAYEDFRKNQLKEDPNDIGYKNLRTKLEIGKSYEDEFKNVDIYYIWIGNKGLKIDFFYESRATSAKFTQEKNGTQISVIFAAD